MSQQEAAVPGDVMSADGFSTFYRAHLATVYGYIHRLAGGDRSLAEDLTQDTFVALTRELRKGRLECADVRWLLTVARSRYVDHVRRQTRFDRKLRLVAGGLDDGATPVEPDRAEVLHSLHSVDAIHRVVLMMRYVDGLAVPEIAQTIGRSVTATHSLLARARDQVRGLARGTA
jgi:RNA polymerase sigma-70 factor (ECF subfamily)